MHKPPRKQITPGGEAEGYTTEVEGELGSPTCRQNPISSGALVKQVVHLAKELTFQGDRLRQRKRISNVAMYDRTELIIEVIKIRVRKAGMEFGKMQPARERYPSTAEFGMFGWCYSGPNREQHAMKKFNLLVKERQEVAKECAGVEISAISLLTLPQHYHQAEKGPSRGDRTANGQTLTANG